MPRRNTSNSIIRKVEHRDELMIGLVRNAQSDWETSGAAHNTCTRMAEFDAVRCQAICRGAEYPGCLTCGTRPALRTHAQLLEGNGLQTDLRKLDNLERQGKIETYEYRSQRKVIMEGLAAAGVVVNEATRLLSLCRRERGLDTGRVHVELEGSSISDEEYRDRDVQQGVRVIHFDPNAVKKRGRPVGSKNRPKEPVRRLSVGEYLDGSTDRTKTLRMPGAVKDAHVEVIQEQQKVKVVLECSATDALYQKIEQEAGKSGNSIGKEVLNILQQYFYQRLELRELQLAIKGR